MSHRERKSGLISRIISTLGPRGLLTWFLLVVILFGIADGLTEVIADLERTFVFGVAVLAATLGWLLTLTPITDWMAAVFGLLMGFEFLLIRVGRLGSGIADIVRAFVRFVVETAAWYWTQEPPNWAAVPQLYWELWSDVWTLLSRMGQWVLDILVGTSVFDPVGSALTWGLGVWICGMWAGWVINRHRQPVVGVLPGGAVLAFVISYTRGNPYFFLPLLGISLVLLALMRHIDREARWIQNDTDYSSGLWSDILVVTTGISIALVVLSAIAPSVTVEKVAEWVREVTESRREVVDETSGGESVAESLGLEQQPQTRERVPLDDVRSTGLPRQHLIGSGPELSREVVMLVETGELAPVPDAVMIGDGEVPQHYWRSVTYDHYFGRGWSTSRTEVTEYRPGDIARETGDVADDPNRRRVRQSVRLIGDGVGGLVHVAGQLVSVSEPYKVAFRPPNEIFAATTEAVEYRADSVIPVITAEELRSASVDYPDWILDRYLRLPEELPDRVSSLARDLTATEPTPYDRAAAIESYLRQFPYTLNVPRPGRQEDIADYFLFELQKGYCDYYATSMVVLARSAGLPARLVVGYASGTYDPVNARYIVTEADAHAWPEIYFPGYGWIEFEPTGGRPAIDRSGSDEDARDLLGDLDLEPLVDRSRGRAMIGALTLGQWLLVIVGSAVGLILLATGIDGLALWVAGTPQVTLSRLYRRLQRHADRLQVLNHRGDTPYELRDAFDARLDGIAGNRPWLSPLLEPAKAEVETIIDLYVACWYRADLTVTREDRRRAVWTWWQLRWRLWLARLWRSPRKERAPMPEGGEGAGGGGASEPLEQPRPTV